MNFKEYIENEEVFDENLNEEASADKTLKNVTMYLKRLGLDISGFEFKPDGKFGKDMRVYIDKAVKANPLLDTLFSEMYVDIAFGYDEKGGGAIKLHYKWETNDGSSNGVRMIKQIRNSKIEVR